MQRTKAIPPPMFIMPSFLLIFHSIYDYYILAGGFNQTRIVENVRDGLIQDGQQIHVFMISTTHGDTLYPKLTLSLKLKKDLVFGASHRIYILKLSICAFTIHLWRYISCIFVYVYIQDISAYCIYQTQLFLALADR